MTIFDEEGKELFQKIETWLESRGILQVGIKNTTRDEDYVWNVYAAMLDGERASVPVIIKVKEIITK